MLRNRFSTVLLTLLLATAIPGTASAADAANDTASQANTPIFQTTPAGGSEEENTEVISPPQTSEPAAPAEVEEPADAQAPEEATAPEIQVQEPVAEVQPPVEAEPEEDAEFPETPIAEPEETAPAEEPIVTEPAIIVDEAATEPAIIVEPEVVAPVEEPVVTEPAIVVEELVTEPAIVVEPVTAALTITHRLIVGDKYLDEIQTIEGLEVGQTVDLKQYYVAETWIEYISNSIDSITLEEQQNSIILEYKPIEGVVVTLSEDIS